MIERSQIAKYFSNYKIRFSLSNVAKDLFSTLGSQYVISTFEPLVIAHPNKILTVYLTIQNQEPVHPLNDMKITDLGLLKSGKCVGCVYFIPKDKDKIDGEITRYALFPTLESFKETQVFDFVRPGNFIKNAIAKVYVKMYENYPIILDSYKQYKSDKTLANTVLSTSIPKCEFDKDNDYIVSNKKAIWVAMHWLENGGAESWAINQIRLAYEAGYDVYVTTDRQSPQRLYADISKYVTKILLCSSILSENDWKYFALKFIDKYDITDIHIHHSAMVYASLLKIKTVFPHIHVADTTHIVEYRGGGFVSDSIAYSNLIDLHHVISPKLLECYINANIDENKVFYRPLTKITQEKLLTDIQEKEFNKSLRIGFIGRYSIQKRPFIYLYIVKYLSTLYPNKFEFYMQGSGELENSIMRKAKVLGVDKKIHFSSWSSPVEFFEKIDVLLIPSENEGLTLTTLEADNSGVLVVSANVGSQETVITKDALIDKQVIKFIFAAKKLLVKLANNKKYYLDLLKEQRNLVNNIRQIESASDFFKNYYKDNKDSK